MSAPGGDLVEQYLDQLYVAAAHLRPARPAGCSPRPRITCASRSPTGWPPGSAEQEAQEHAVSSFGSVRAVVRAHDARLRRLPTRRGAPRRRPWPPGGWARSAWSRSGCQRPDRVGDERGVRPRVRRRRPWRDPLPRGRLPALARHSGRTRTAARRPRCWRTAATRCPCGWPPASSAWPRWPAYHLARRRSRDLLPDSFTPTVAMALFGAAGPGPGRDLGRRHRPGHALGAGYRGGPASTPAARSWPWSWPSATRGTCTAASCGRPVAELLTARNEPSPAGAPLSVTRPALRVSRPGRPRGTVRVGAYRRCGARPSARCPARPSGRRRTGSRPPARRAPRPRWRPARPGSAAGRARRAPRPAGTAAWCRSAG